MSFGHVGLVKAGSVRPLRKLGEGQVVDNLPNMDQQEQEEKTSPPPSPPKDVAQKRKPEHPAIIAGKSIAGMGLGTLAGYGTMKGLELAGAPVPSGALRTIVPITTGVLGLASPYLYQATLDRMHKSHRERQGIRGG